MNDAALATELLLHFKRHDDSRQCHWCGADLLNGEAERATVSKNLWRDNEDCCQAAKPLTLEVFDEESMWCSFGFDESVIEIDDNTLAARLKLYTPLVRRDGKLWQIKKVHPRNTAFTWEPKLTTEATAREITVTPTFHGCAYYGFFKPSLSEVLAQVPANPEINAFYIETDTVKVCRCGGGHIAKTHWVALA